jgi:hypothetical protein
VDGRTQLKFTDPGCVQHCSSFITRECLATSAWIMAEHTRRNKTNSRLSKSAESLPNEIMRPHHTG